MTVKISNITKKYGDIAAVKNASLELQQGELLALLGPSGCGKTTLLRTIAGLIEHESGKISIDERDITNLSPQKRNTALVFQSYALFPHLSVADNILYGLKNKGLSKKDMKTKLNKITKIVELEDYLDRHIHELSGGQQQRVALARALILEPDMLLFDEPLSNLDEKLRVNMRQEIRKIQKRLNITSIYVTHDQKEALSISDKIAVMNKGTIEQIGHPDEIYHNPKNAFVANFIGKVNMIEPKILNRNEGTVLVDLLGNKVELKTSQNQFLCLIRPEEIYPVEKSGLTYTIDWVENLGNILRYTLKNGNKTLIMDRLNRINNIKFSINEEIDISFNASAAKVIKI